MNDELIHEQVRQILREGDPAAQEAGLTPDEVHTLRRAVLNAIPESRRRFGLPLLAAGAAVLILLVLVFVLGPWSRSPLTPPPAPQVAAVPTPAPAPPAPSAPAAPSQRPLKPSSKPAGRAVQPPKAPPVRHDETMTLASLPETSTVREIRFSAPGGTRIIWELSTNDAR